MSTEIIHRDELVLVAPPQHVLTQAEAVSLRDLAKHSLLIPKQGRRREVLDLLFAEQRVAPRIGMELDSNELMKRLILADMGVGFLPKINVLDELRTEQLRAIPVEGVQLRRDLALIYHRDRVLTRAGKVFLQVATGGTRLP